MNLNKTRTVNSGHFEAVLRGEGDLVPELTITSFRDNHSTGAYVVSEDLRVLGEKFIKWADKLDVEEASRS